MKVYTRRWRTLPCLWACKINIVEIVILPKAIYRLDSKEDPSKFQCNHPIKWQFQNSYGNTERSSDPE